MANIFADGHKLIDDSDWKNTNVGTNLLIGSHDFSGQDWYMPNTANKLKDSIGNITSLSPNVIWNGSSPIMNIKAQKWYTLSFNLKVTSWTDGEIYLYSSTGAAQDDQCLDFNSFNVTIEGNVLNQKLEADGIILSDYIRNNNLVGKELRVIFRFFSIKDGRCLARVESDKTALTCLTSSYKLEYGTTATQWSPAPSDLAFKSDVISLQDQINKLQSKLGG